MKKRLLCLPLVATMLGGCSILGFEIPGSGLLAKLDVLGLFTGKDNGGSGSGSGSGSGQGSGQGSGTQTGGGGGGGSISVSGTPVATITMSKCQDMTSEGVFSKDGYTVTVSQGQNTNDTIAKAVENSQTYEFRVYAKMDLTFAGPSAFSKLLIKYSNFTSDGKTFYFDYEELDGATNEFDNSSYQALVTLDSASTSFTVNCWHQTRIASVAFYA